MPLSIFEVSKQKMQHILLLNVAFIFSLIVSTQLSAQVSGRVFRDFNANGVYNTSASYNEVGLAGITIKAYNTSGTEVGSATSAANGTYTIASVSGAVRIIFSGLPAASFATSSEVRFVTAPATNINFGVNEPDDYWDSSSDPRYVIPCYVNGLSSGNATTEAAVISTPNSSLGLNSAYQNFQGTQGTGPMPNMDATIGQIGSVWGEAYYKTQKHMYFSTFLKRHSGMADGPGYIYNFDYTNPAAPTMTGKFNLQGVMPNNGGVAIDFGTVDRTGGTDYTLPADKNTLNIDLDAFAKVGKMAYGDIEMQPYTGYLWAVNLCQRTLIRIDVSGNPTTTPSDVNQYILSSITGFPTSSTGVLRPCGLKFQRGKGYLGVISDASISNMKSDLRAYVLEFDPNNITAGFTTVLDFDQNIKRGTLSAHDQFNPWLDTWSIPPIVQEFTNHFELAQGLLSDIEFDENGNMYVAFMDRFGHQVGFLNRRPLSGNTEQVRTNGQGELLKACYNGTSWSIEGTGSCHTGGEYIQDIAGDTQPESSEGAIALLKGRNQILAVVVDPHPQGSVGQPWWTTQGVNTYNLSNGQIDNWYGVYYGGVPVLGKANGLGGVEYITGVAPITIGNRVWVDTDMDGIQDAGEQGIVGVTIKLFEGSTEVGSTTTDTEGVYAFNSTNVTGGIKPHTAYQVRIDATQGGIADLRPAAIDAAADNIDNDAVLSGTNFIASITTGNYGENIDNLDFGLMEDKDGDGVSNYVDIDTDNDGILNHTEGGIICANSVQVSLNTVPYAFNTLFNANEMTTPVQIDNLLFGSLDFTAKLIGNTEWDSEAGSGDGTSGGVQIKKDSGPTVGHYIYMQPDNTNTINTGAVANTNNYAEYELNFSTAVSGLQFISAGLNNDDTYEIYAFNGSTPVALNSSNLSNFIPTTNWTTYDLGNALKIVSTNGGGADVDDNLFTTSIDNLVTRVVIRAYKNTTSSASNTSPVTTAITSLQYCTTNVPTDTDNDGIPNYLDLDSDNDGCSDAFEAGATTDLTANYVFTGAMGVNGLVDTKEILADTSILNYTPTYNNAINNTIKSCVLPPVAVNDVASGNEDALSIPGTVNTNDSDPNNDINPNSFTVVTNPKNGTITLNNNGTFSYVPNLNFNGNDTVSYRVCDLSTPTPLCDTAILVITVNSVNDLPIANTEGVTLNEDAGATTVLVLTNDTFGGDGASTGAITITAQPTNGTASVNNNGTPTNPTDDRITYTPTANFNGNDTLIYRIEDANGDFDTAIVYLTITSVNDMPMANVDAATLNEDAGATTVLVLTNDTFGGDGASTGAITITAQPTNGTASVNNNGTPTNPTDDRITYTPTANFNGNDTLIYRIEDVNGDFDTAIVYLTITSVNDMPMANVDAATLNEDAGATTVLVLTNDTFGGDGASTGAITITAQPTNGTASVNNNGTPTNPTDDRITYTPTANFNGNDTLIYRIEDANGDFDTAIVYLTITSVNDMPMANVDAATLNEDAGATTVLVLTNDTFGGDGASTGAITITAQPTNGTASVNNNGTPTNPTDDRITYTPTANFNGNDTLIYRIEDANGDFDTAIVYLTITSVNDMPMANVDAATLNEDAGATTVLVLTNDTFGGDGASTGAITITAQPTNGTASVNNNGTPTNPTDDRITYTPTANFNGNDTLIYRIEDANGDFDTAIVYLTITSVNDMPMANVDAATLNEDAGATTVLVLTNDTFGGDGASTGAITITAQPTNGTASVNNNGTPTNPTDDRITYTPTANFNGNDTLIYRIEDANGDFDTAIVYLTITSVNDMPMANVDAATLNEDAGATTVLVLTNDTFGGDGASTGAITITAQPTNGTASVNNNGTPTNPTDDRITYTPTANFNGNDTLIYRIEDANGDFDTAIVYLTITSVNDMPMANVDAATLNEDAGATTVLVLTNDTFGGDGASTGAITITAQPTNGTASVNNNGTPTNPTDDRITYTPTANFNGNDTLIYRIEDANGDFDTAIVYLTITSVNDMPMANVDAATLNEDAGATTVLVLTNDTFGGDGASTGAITITAQPTNGTASVNNNGTPTNPTDDRITYTPTANFNGNDTLIYRIEDANGDFDTAIVYLTITSVNDMPMANVDAATLNEDAGATTVLVLTNDTFGGDGASTGAITITAQPTNGTASVNNNGTPTNPTDDRITYTPTANFNGNDTLIYRIEDANGDFDTAIVYLTITSVNDMPMANVDAATLNEDAGATTVLVLTNDTFGGDGASTGAITITAQPTNGTASVNNNGTPTNPTDDRITYTPTANFNGNDTLIYRIEDANGDFDTAIVYLTITSVNDAPIANRNDVTVTENNPLTFNILGNDTDTEGVLDTANVTVLENPKNGTFIVNLDGTIQYTPNPNFNGNDTLVYRVCDMGMPVLCDTALVVISVSPVNYPPIAVNDTNAGNEDNDITGTVTTGDSDPDNNLNPTSYTKLDDPTFGSIVFNNNGTYTYTPDANFNGVDSIHYRVCDTEGLCDTATLIITVNAVNDKPIAVDDVANTTVNNSIGGTVTTGDFDVDNNLDINSFVKIGDPINGSITINTNGSFNYTPDTDFVGKDSVQYRVCDLGMPILCDTAWLVINVIQPNRPPVATDILVFTDVNTSVDSTLTALVSDLDGNLDNNSFVKIGDPINGTITINTNGTFTYTPNAGYVGEDSVRYRVCDAAGLCDTAWVLMLVEQPNRPPVLTDLYLSIPQDLPIDSTVTLNASDLDGNLDVNSFTVIVNPNNGMIALNPNGSFTYTPNAGFIGQDTITYKVCDLGTSALCDTAKIIVFINFENHAPVAINDTITTNEDTAINDSVASNVTDIDNNLNPTSFVTIGDTVNGTITLNNNGTYTYTPNANFSGKDSVSYRACDYLGLCDTAWIFINVNPVNNAPIANRNDVTTTEDNPLTFNILGNDTDTEGVLDTANVTVLENPKNGTFIVNLDGTIQYTPNPNFNGNDTLVYRVCDMGMPVLCDTALVVISVSPVNDAPIANVDAQTVPFNGNVNIPVKGNDSDIDTAMPTTTVSINEPPRNGTANVNPDGTISYSPNTGFIGLDTLIYNLCDNGSPNLCDTAIVFINVSFANNPPIAVNDTNTGDEDTNISGTVSTGDSDPDGNLNPNSYAQLDQPISGSIVFNTDGTYTYTPNANYNGVDSIHYRVCDTEGVCDTATLIITINPVNDKPVAVDDIASTTMNNDIGGTVATNDLDIDVNLNPNSFVQIGNTINGTITINPNGSFNYTPNTDFVGRDSVQYQVCDLGMPILCDTAWLVIVVTRDNRPPVATDLLVLTNVDTPANGTLTGNVSDPDGNLNPNSFAQVGNPVNGSISINPNGTFTYTPNAGYVGEDSVKYQVCDAAGLCDTAWILVIVEQTNRPPVAINDMVSTPVSTPVNGTLVDNVSDTDGNLNPNSFTQVGNPTSGTITINTNGTYTYTPNTGFTGRDSVQFRVCDTEGLCDTAWIIISINQPNRPPVALNDVVSTAMNSTYNGNLTSKVSDPDGNLNPNSFAQVSNALHGSMTINPNGTYTYIPTTGFVGQDSVQYQVCDALALCDTAWIVITILDAKPIAVDDAYTTNRNTIVGFKPTVNDNPKGNIVSVNVIMPTKNGSLNFVGIDSIRYTPNNGYCGNDTMTYSVCNQFGLCDTAQIVINISCIAIPNPPVTLDDIATTNKNQPVLIAVLDNDTTNAPITSITIISNPTRGTVIIQGNDIIYTPTTDSCGQNDVFEYAICTANGCDTARVTVSVNCGTVNNNSNQPVAVDDNYTTDKGVSITFKPTLNDTINGTLTGLNVISFPRHGLILFRSPDTLIYTPQSGYCGRDTLAYVILNDKGLSDTATVFITINCIPDVATALPVALNDVTTTLKNRPVSIAVLDNDTLNGTLIKPITIIKQGKTGTAILNGNDILYTPNNGVCGINDTLTYEICNIQGCDTAEVIVSITCPPAIIAVDNNYTTNLNTLIGFNPTLNDTINGVLNNITIVANAKHGNVGIIGRDSMVYTPATGYCGRDTIEYSITRDDNETARAFIYITINCGAKPDAILDVSTGVKNTSKIITVLTNDAPNGTLTKPVTVIIQPTKGTVTVNASNEIVYTPATDSCGFTDTLTYEICNAAGCDTAEVLVTINCIPLPDARNDVAVTGKNKIVDIDALTNDDLNGALDSFQVVTQPIRGTVSIVNGKLRYVPQTDSCGYNDTLTYKICIPNACDTATVIITVTCDTVKTPPVANMDIDKTVVNVPITINVLTNDSLYNLPVDTMYIVQQPKNGTVIISQVKDLFYVPTASYCGTDTLSYNICTKDGCDTALVIINIACDTPAIPVAVFDMASTLRGVAIDIDLIINDTLNDADTIRVIQPTKYGTATIDIDGFMTYQPDGIFCGGTDTAIYEICNLRGCDTALVLIEVRCDSIGLLLPKAFDDIATTQIDSAIIIDILDNDTLRGATIQDSLVSKPRHGSVIITNGAAFYMPNPGYWGRDTFEYVICNTNGCDTAMVIITIDPGSSLVIFNGFSPNGDGVNEAFLIRGIENYPENEVIIWNRWGNEVGRVKGYNNADKAWNGTWKNMRLPDGTYFYCINFGDGSTKSAVGYIQINK